jgi:hypothetical protein
MSSVSRGGDALVRAQSYSSAASRIAKVPERQQGQRQLAGGQGGIGSVQSQPLQVGQPAFGELDRLGGPPGEPVGLREVVPRRADPFGVVAVHGKGGLVRNAAEPRDDRQRDTALA